MKLGPTEFEALSWLQRNGNKSALATNRFATTAEAVEAVKELYAAGATIVKVGDVLDEPERIQREGGPYTDTIELSFPEEKADSILAVVRKLQPDMGGRRKDIFLDDLNRSPSMMLTWD